MSEPISQDFELNLLVVLEFCMEIFAELEIIVLKELEVIHQHCNPRESQPNQNA